MPIKNYTTKVPAAKTAGEIQAMLAKHGASKTMTEYDGAGNPTSVSFVVDGHAFRLPTRVDSVRRVMNEQGVKADHAKAERVAWRNVKDWIDAQIAMVEIGQAELSEVMLPYMLDAHGNTLYEALPRMCLPAVGFDEAGDDV